MTEENVGRLEQSQMSIFASIGELKGLTAGINTRLDRLNGSVQESMESLRKTQLELALHPASCPIRTAVDEIQRELETGDHPGSRIVNEALMRFNEAYLLMKSERETKKSVWQNIFAWTKPIIIGFFLAVLALLAIHFNDIWSHKP